MCGCYELKARNRALNRRFPQLHSDHGDLPRSGEMNPNDPVLMITAGNPGFVGSLARWGLVGSFLDQPPRNPLLTLPGEGLASKPFYSKILKRNRCLIPATAFHEWQTLAGGKQKMRISEAHGELLAFAGIYDHHPLAGTTCAILTTVANASVGRIHPRMPVILDRDESSFWLSDHADFPEADFAALLHAPSQHELTMEAIIAAEPSPQLSLAFG